MRNTDYGALEKTHDLSLPEWGPYSKRFFGISHIPDASGDRFDFAVAPGLHRRCIFPPDALRPCGYLPWDISADLEHYSIRQQLEWKDLIYCDTSFHKISGNIRLVRCHLVNNTERVTNFNLHFFSQYVPEPAGRVVTDADRYFRCEIKSETGLEYDFMFPGEFRTAGTTSGSAYRIKKAVPFAFTLDNDNSGRFFLRARGDGKVTVECDGRKTTLDLDDEWRFFELENRSFEGGRAVMSSDADFICDGLFLTQKEKVTLLGSPVDSLAVIDVEAPDSIIWHYPGTGRYYGLRLDSAR